MVLLRSIATVGGYTLASRVLGFARDILIALILGAGWIADAFFVAFKLPNFFRRLFAEGAFNAAFVPLFAGQIAEGNKAQARGFAEEVLSVLITVLVLFVALFEVLMPWAMLGFAPGFTAEPAKFDLAVQLTRITFPYLLFISLVSLLGGVLNALERFAAVAATPILLNLMLIGSLLWLARHTDTPGHALAWGVTAAGIIQFLWLIAALSRAGVTLRLSRPRLTPRLRRLLVLMVPGALGAGVVQVNLLIDIVIASLLPTGSVSYLYYADRVNQLPLGVVGVAVGAALLPLLARSLRAGDGEAAMTNLNRALEFAAFLAIPGAAALIVIANPVIAVLFERGAFGPAETQATAAALAAYAAGLPAYVGIKVLGPAFFAREDTVTPVKVAAFCVALNLGLNLALMGPLAHVGIALATAISAWINAAFLAGILWRRGFLVLDSQLRRRLPRILAATAAMAALLAVATGALAALFEGNLAVRAGALSALVLGGLIGYGVLAQFTGSIDLRELKRMFGKESP